MQKLLLQSALERISSALPDLPLFTEKVRQGYQPPALFLAPQECSIRRELGSRFRAEGTFSLTLEPSPAEAFAAADLLAALEEAFRGRDGFLLSKQQIRPDGTATALLTVSAVGFWNEDPPPLMGKMNVSLELGSMRKDD
ncbi:MAG: phage tail terminator family protein [Candidatus Merdivicinus sp.]|jgi:hypothetical protein